MQSAVQPRIVRVLPGARGSTTTANRSQVQEIATSSTVPSHVPTAVAASGLARAVNQARLLLEVSAPISTLRKRARTCRAVSGAPRAASPTTEVTPLLAVPAPVPTTLSPVGTFQAANGLVSPANLL